MAASADISFKAYEVVEGVKVEKAVKVDVEEWEKLFDTALVAFVAHKLEELIREVLADVVTWCPEIAHLISAHKNTDDLVKKLNTSKSNDPRNRYEVWKWMECIKITLGGLINFFDKFKSDLDNNKAEQTLLGKCVINLPKRNKWLQCVRAAENYVEKIHKQLLIGKHWNKTPYPVLREMNKTRNSVMHHDGVRDPCLKLDEDKKRERSKLIKQYKSLIESDLLKIIDDQAGTKRKKYLKVINISDWRAILQSYQRLEGVLKQRTAELDAEKAKAEAMKSEKDATIDQLERDIAEERESSTLDSHQLEASQNEIDELKRKLETLRKEKEKIDDEYATAQDKLENNEILNERLEADVKEYKAKAESAEEKYSDLTKEMVALQVKNNSLTEENETLKEQLESALQKVEEKPDLSSEKGNNEGDSTKSSTDPNQLHPDSDNMVSVGEYGVASADPLSTTAEAQSQNPVNLDLVQQLAATAGQQRTGAPTGEETGPEQAAEQDNSIQPAEDGE